MLYVNEFTALYDALSKGLEVKTVWKQVVNNVYPIWHLWLKIKEFEFLPFIIGNGMGSVRVINNFYTGANELQNPNAQIIRAIYETGVLGTLLFVTAFLAPLKKMYIDHKIKIRVKIFMLLMLGMYFGHKSAIPFIFLGVAFVVLRSKLKAIKSNNITNSFI